MPKKSSLKLSKRDELCMLSKQLKDLRGKVAMLELKVGGLMPKLRPQPVRQGSNVMHVDFRSDDDNDDTV